MEYKIELINSDKVQIYNTEKYKFEKHNGKFFALISNYFYLTQNYYNYHMCINIGLSLEDGRRKLQEYSGNTFIYQDLVLIGFKSESDVQNFIEYIESLEIMAKLTE